MARVIEHDGVVYRRLDGARGEHRAAVDLQARVWAPDVAIPDHQLIAADSTGALVLGAFHERALIGLCYGFPAHRDGDVWLHSHQTGVDRAFRDRGVGRTLKWLQRDLALRAGYERITWTFDPLQARNAHVNLVKLGATSDRYVVDYYGELTDVLPTGLPSDRLWVTWRLDGDRVRARFASFLAATAIDWPATSAVDGDVTPAPGGSGEATVPRPAAFATREVDAGVRAPDGEVTTDLDAPQVLVETPTDVAAVREVAGGPTVRAWRLRQREAFTAHLGRGYVAVGLRTADDGGGRRAWYVLERGGGA